eukprot:scaffold72722_cov40-Attheya_sp.AAC.2
MATTCRMDNTSFLQCGTRSQFGSAAHGSGSAKNPRSARLLRNIIGYNKVTAAPRVYMHGGAAIMGSCGRIILCIHYIRIIITIRF